jgi:hypothetical protein
MTSDEMAQKILAKARIIAARPPRRQRSELALNILIRARIITLRRQAEGAARAYHREAARQDREAVDRRAANDDLPPRHRQLRQMLLGIARGDRDAQSPKLLPPPRKGA